MTPKKSKSRMSKGKQRATATPNVDATTEPPNADHEAFLDGVAAAVPDASTNSKPPGVDYEAELNSILDEYDEAQAQAALSSSVRDNTSRNDASSTISDSELEVSNRFPDVEELNRQIIFNQFELRQDLDLPPPAMHQDHQALWDAMADNHEVMKNLHDTAKSIRAAWTQLYNAGSGSADTFKQWEQKVRQSPLGWVHDKQALALYKRLTVEANVAEAMNKRYDEDKEKYLSAFELAESTTDASQALAEEVAIANRVVLVSDLEDLEDVYLNRPNRFVLQRVVSRYEEALERWHKSGHDGDEREPAQTAGEPDEGKTPLRGRTTWV